MIALSVRRAAVIGSLALAAGGAAAVAQAAGGGVAKPVQTQVVPAAAALPVDRLSVPVAAALPVDRLPGRRGRLLRAVPVPAGVARPLRGPAAVCVPRRPGAKTAPAAAPKPPGEALRNAFGILRRERQDEDALPAAALAALKASGLAPVDPASARLLRADGGGRAWVVPVPDARVVGYGCGPDDDKPQEGLAVVSSGGGTAAGGGGELRELLRGQAPVALDPCAGAGRDMLGVSGIVPDGVAAVFITATDGTAVRADVHDNGYAFVLPRPTRPEARFLVWTGKNGSPRVQPLPFALGGREACPKAVTARARVTPDAFGSICTPLGTAAAVPPVARILPAPHPRPIAPRTQRRPARTVPAPRRPARRIPAPRPASPPRAVLAPAAAVSVGCVFQPAAALPPAAAAPVAIVPSRAQPRGRRGP